LSAPAKPGTTGQREAAPADVTASRGPSCGTILSNLMTYVTILLFQKLFGYSERMPPS